MCEMCEMVEDEYLVEVSKNGELLDIKRVCEECFHKAFDN